MPFVNSSNFPGFVRCGAAAVSGGVSVTTLSASRRIAPRRRRASTSCSVGKSQRQSERSRVFRSCEGRGLLLQRRSGDGRVRPSLNALILASMAGQVAVTISGAQSVCFMPSLCRCSRSALTTFLAGLLSFPALGFAFGYWPSRGRAVEDDAVCDLQRRDCGCCCTLSRQIARQHQTPINAPLADIKFA